MYKSPVMRRLFTLCSLCLLTLAGKAGTLSSEARISILTCSPGSAIYEKFGHTAILVVDSVEDVYEVWNYGLFGAIDDKFVVHFVKGETDYMLGCDDPDRFRYAYAYEGRRVNEQRLMLDSAACNAIYDALEENYRPENRKYRYNFIFDNCATRPYLLICKALGASPSTPQFDRRRDSFRSRIAHYTGESSWSLFGINLVLGQDADAIMTPDDRIFLPEELMDRLSEARIDGRPFVIAQDVMPFDVEPPLPWLYRPQAMLTGLLLLMLLLSLLDIRRGRRRWWADAVLFVVSGMVGILICFLWGWSEHPFVRHNWNLLFFNPLSILLALMTLTARTRCWLERMQPLMLLYGVIGLVVYILSPQTTHPMGVLLGVLLILRSGVSLWLSGRLTLKGRLRHVALLLLPMLSFSAPMPAAEPSLLVTIVVDGLDMPSLDRLGSRLGSGGLTQMMQSGQTYGAVYFPQQINGGGESVATMLTGQTPAQHGYAADFFFDRRTRSVRQMLADPSQPGIGTRQTFSSRALGAPTFTDMLRLRFERSSIYAVGLSGQISTLLSGHQGKAAVWIDPDSLRWVASGSYDEGLPLPAARLNRVDTIRKQSGVFWTPEKPLDTYLVPSARELSDHGFAYNPSIRLRGQAHPCLLLTPLANDLVADLALQLQQYHQLGQHADMDALMLQMTVRTPAAGADYIASAEQEDMYIRFNRTLARLTDELTRRLGRDRLLFVICGRPVQGQPLEVWREAGWQGGHFSTTRCAALTNTYLMAIHGNENWIIGGYGNQLFLNRPLIAQRHLDLQQMQDEVAQFLLEFEGVQAAYGAMRLPTLVVGPDEVETSRIRTTYNKQTGGDVVFTLQTGWDIVDERGQVVDRVREQNPQVPLLIWPSADGRVRDDNPLSAARIAGIVCRLLKLPGL
ncbi:MAG: DUF4105 domain-containing protein [Paludibacteraceae bacterium]|nr:DUF4105 domain-containing protein [Paludibacteraceae bacterium]